jgi:ribokinase
MRGHVCVVGSVNMDLVAQTPNLPLPGQTVMGGSFATHPGGKGANQSVAAARAGASVSFVGCVGDDAFGQQLRATLTREGVDTSHLHTRAHTPSGVALIAVAVDGQNSIIVAPGANATLSVAEIEAAADAIASAQVLLLQLETPLESVIAAAQIARRAGVRTVLNPAPAQLLPAALLAVCDLLVPNEGEAALLSGLPVHDLRSADAAGRALLARGASRVIVTLGAQGALLVEPSGFLHLPAYPVQAVDTTAAGDALLGAFAAAEAAGASTVEALRWGVAAGALATTLPGAQPSLPYRRAIQALLRQE